VATTAAFVALTSWTAAELKPALEAVGETFGLKPGKAQASTRVAITGRAVGPPLYESMELLGRDESLRRMRELAAAAA
jgi:glutamyl-tRNA synthetase